VFEPLRLGPPGNLFIAVFGRPGTGKTRLIGTAPGLGVIPLQRKTLPTIEQVKRELYPHRTILWPKNPDELYKYANPMTMALMEREESKKFHRELVDKIKASAWALLARPEVKTIGIDDGTTLYNMMACAYYGKSSRFSADAASAKKAYGPINDEFQEFLVSLESKNVVMSFQGGEAYVKDVAQGFDEPKGYKQIGFHANALVETRFDIADGFWIDVRMCQDRAALQGEQGQRLLLGDLCEFKYLAQQLRPDSASEDWE